LNLGIDECHQHVLAFRSSAGKEVRGPALMILENDLGFEECVDR
jgi:hypothetical protein